MLAIIFQEPEAERIARAIADAAERKMSCMNWLECLIVVEARRGPEQVMAALALLAAMRIEMLAFDAVQMEQARTAWQRFGKGRHPARLNLLDCCAYAAANSSGEPLLFIGNDFGQTDVDRAPW
ncbi:MAG TPA: type II toxin-antitoxin system VapC family toxin [Terriglobales bacterium]